MSGQEQLGDDPARLRFDKVSVLSAVAKLAESHGIRVLAAGGPVFAARGLISPRVSRWASVIVDPARIEDLMRLLLQAGWKWSPARANSAMLPSVVVDLSHDAWSVELYLYAVFPGFYREVEDVFEVLWERRESSQFQGVRVFTIDQLATIVMAFHDRLGAQSWSTKALSHEEFHIRQFREVLGARDRVEFYELVKELGAEEPMRPLLMALGIDIGDIALPTQNYARWRLHLPSVGPAALAMLALIECPPQRRLLQSLRVLRQSPKTVARAALGWPRALWLVSGTQRRARAQFPEFQRHY